MTEMERFQQQAALCQRDTDIDALCWNWLRDAAYDNGREGQLALKLMRLIQEELMP